MNLEDAAKIAGLDADAVLEGPLSTDEIKYFSGQAKAYLKTLGITKGALLKNPSVDPDLHHLFWMGFEICPGLSTRRSLRGTTVFRAYTIGWQEISYPTDGSPEEYEPMHDETSVEANEVIPEILKKYIDSLGFLRGQRDLGAEVIFRP